MVPVARPTPGRVVRAGRVGLAVPLLATLLAGTVSVPASAEIVLPRERPVGEGISGPSTSAPRPATNPGLVTIAGSGYGHGVGLSQYGALGMARAGTGAEQIVQHYYTSVAVTGVRDAVDIRVNVVHRGRSVVLRPIGINAGTVPQARLVPSTGTPILLGPGDVATATPSGTAISIVVVRGSGARVQRTVSGWSVEWTGTAAWSGPATRLAVGSRAVGSSAVKERSYRWGRLALTNVSKAIEAVTTVDLHSGYLRGLAEMPSSWPTEALRAQAIIARSYALVAAGKAPRADCGGCQVWDDQRSQMYVGWAKEGERVGSTDYGARWIAAVTSTSPTSTTGIAVLYQGKPVQTFYASSTGGRTRDPKLVWGGSVPYLRPVADPWSLDSTLNPRYAAWTRTFSPATLARTMGISDGSPLASVTVTARDAAGAITQVRATSRSGQVRTLAGESFRSRLGLPSSWVTSVRLPT